MKIKVTDRVSYTDKPAQDPRLGTVIEINQEETRARIRWDEGKLRTWIRIPALKILSAGV
jgi:hypothetical protein